MKKFRVSSSVSVIAHQFRNPLYVIKVYLEALSSESIGSINKKQKEYLGDVLKNVSRMLGLVDDLLDISGIEEKRYDMKPEPLDLAGLVQLVVDDFVSWSKGLNCKIIFERPRAFPLVYADSVKIRRVIENLISNAVKYKSAGKGKVIIKLAKKGRKEILFSCSDNGIGILKEDYKKIFSKFYRSEDAIIIDPSGSGLGLYIIKAILEMHKGRIWFKKNRARGMTFYFTLPVYAKGK